MPGQLSSLSALCAVGLTLLKNSGGSVSTLAKQTRFFICVSFLALQACSANGAGGVRSPIETRPAPTSVKLAAPKSISPGTVPAPPMASTKPQSAEFISKRFPKSDIGAPQWIQLTGGASQISAAGDGSFWVLSPDGPNGGLNASDKFIYHNVNGVWINVGGAAAHISAAQDGSLWVVNSLGGIYHNINNTWYPIAGGAKDISVAPNGTIYVISKAPGNAGIFHYDGANWTQLPGAATSIAASPDTASHGVFAAGGVWVTNSFGEIYYFSPGVGFTQLSGKAAQIVPTKNGGIFVLGFPVISSGNPLYYNNLDTGVWTQIPGGAVNLATDTNYLYAIGGTGGIYKTPVLPAATPAPAATVGPAFAYMTRQNGSFVSAIAPTSQFGIVINVSTVTETTTTGSSPSVPVDALSVKVGGSASTFANLRAPRSYLENLDAVTRAGRPTLIFAKSTKFRPDFDPADVSLREALRLMLSATQMGRVTNAVRRTQTLATFVGATANLWTSTAAIGQATTTQIQVPATLQAISAHAYVWVDNTLSLSPSSLTAIGMAFDNAYASDVAHFGTPEYTTAAPLATSSIQPCDSAGNMIANAPPINLVISPPNGMHIVFIVNQGNLGAGLGGYFTSINHFTQGFANCFTGQPKSNEASMIYLGFDPMSPLSYNLSEDIVRGTSHEFQHLINFVNKVVLARNPVSEDRWINEGLSMLSQDYAVNRMFPSVPLDVSDALGHAAQFMQQPQRYNLTGFTGADSSGLFTYNCSGCYGLSYLYQRYLADRFGGDAYLRAMESSTTTSVAGIQAITGVAPSQTIADFAVALVQSGSGLTADSRYNFKNFNPYGKYTDQFGLTTTLQGPGVLTAAPGITTTASAYVGTFNYVQIQPFAGLGAGVTVTDLGGAFGLQAGLLQF